MQGCMLHFAASLRSRQCWGRSQCPQRAGGAAAGLRGGTQGQGPLGPSFSGKIGAGASATPAATRHMSGVAAEATAAGGSALQHLFEAARRHFRHGNAPPQALEELCSLAAAVPLEELGFRPGLVGNPRAYLEDLQQPQGLLARARGSKPHPLLRGQVTYQEIYEDHNFTLGIFFLPPGGSIPLHDHPGMTVVSRLLFGRLHVMAYDPLLAQASGTAPAGGAQAAAAAGAGGGAQLQAGPQGAPPQYPPAGITSPGILYEAAGSGRPGPRSGGGGSSSQGSSGDGGSSRPSSSGRSSWHQQPQPTPVIQYPSQFQAVFRSEAVVEPGSGQPMVLLPNHCNIHEFRALGDAPCAVLDILAPPYEPAIGRDCTYFQIRGAGGQAGSSVPVPLQPGAIVEMEVDPDHQFVCSSTPYRGLQVVP